MYDFKPGGLVAVDVTGMTARKRTEFAGRTFRITKVNPKMLITKDIANGEDVVIPKERALNRTAGTLTQTPAPNAPVVTEILLPESYTDIIQDLEKKMDERQDLFKKFALGTVVRHIGPKHQKWPYKDGALLVVFKVDTFKNIVNIALLGGDGNAYWRVPAAHLEVVPTPK